jgi:hypothetical protein
MCTVCDEYGGLGCPACIGDEFLCPRCGEYYPPDEATEYAGDCYCRKCYDEKNEESDAKAEEAIYKKLSYKD